MNEIKFTKQEFRTLMDLNVVDLRANNLCFYMDKKYEIKVIDDKNEVVLKEVK